MANHLFLNIKNGLKKIQQNPQLVYTIVVAILITLAFVLMANRFVSIANNAQERLINVRIGSIQDAFVSFASDSINNPLYLNERIRDVMANNATIKNFKIVSKQTSTTSPETFLIIASNNQNEIGQEDNQAKFLYTLATSDPNNSLTTEFNNEGERFFNTARAIKSVDGEILGVVLTTQTLSQADRMINTDIKNSILMLVFVIILIMLLFLRHSRIIDYTVLYKKLKEVDQLKDDFISMASHELRTPLAVIRGYAEFIREAPELSTETIKYATQIDASAKDLDTLVADILDVSRIEQGRMSFKFERQQPKTIIEEVVSSLLASTKSKGLNLFIERTEDAFVNIDKDRFKQVLINIIGNAVKYTKKGDIKINQYIEKNYFYIRISDTGIGMTAEEQKKLFEKFYRVRNSDTEDIRGTGLGLWITAEIIREMNGKISVESIKGVGSHFIVSFPIIS